MSAIKQSKIENADSKWNPSAGCMFSYMNNKKIKLSKNHKKTRIAPIITGKHCYLCR